MTDSKSQQQLQKQQHSIEMDETHLEDAHTDDQQPLFSGRDGKAFSKAIARRNSPSHDRSPTSSFKPRRSDEPIRYPTNLVASTVNYNAAQYVVLLFIFVGFIYVVYDIYHPEAFHNFKNLNAESIPKLSTTIPATHLSAEGWLARVNHIDGQLLAHGGNAQIVLMGDSITEHWEDAGQSAYAKLQSKYRTVNLGVAGDNIEHLLWRITNGLGGQLQRASTSESLHTIFLLIGTNNARHDSTHREILYGIRRLVQQTQEELGPVKAAYVQIVIFAIFPRADFNRVYAWEQIQGVNGNLKRAIESHDDNVYVYDINSLFMQGRKRIPYGLVDRFPPINPQMYQPDRLHLSAEGYHVWLEEIEKLAAKHQAIAEKKRKSANARLNAKAAAETP